MDSPSLKQGVTLESLFKYQLSYFYDIVSNLVDQSKGFISRYKEILYRLLDKIGKETIMVQVQNSDTQGNLTNERAPKRVSLREAYMKYCSDFIRLVNTIERNAQTQLEIFAKDREEHSKTLKDGAWFSEESSNAVSRVSSEEAMMTVHQLDDFQSNSELTRVVREWSERYNHLFEKFNAAQAARSEAEDISLTLQHQNRELEAKTRNFTETLQQKDQEILKLNEMIRNNELELPMLLESVRQERRQSEEELQRLLFLKTEDIADLDKSLKKVKNKVELIRQEGSAVKQGLEDTINKLLYITKNSNLYEETLQQVKQDGQAILTSINSTSVQLEQLQEKIDWQTSDIIEKLHNENFAAIESIKEEYNLSTDKIIKHYEDVIKRMENENYSRLKAIREKMREKEAYYALKFEKFASDISKNEAASYENINNLQNTVVEIENRIKFLELELAASVEKSKFFAHEHKLAQDEIVKRNEELDSTILQLNREKAQRNTEVEKLKSEIRTIHAELNEKIQYTSQQAEIRKKLELQSLKKKYKLQIRNLKHEHIGEVERLKAIFETQKQCLLDDVQQAEKKRMQTEFDCKDRIQKAQARNSKQLKEMQIQRQESKQKLIEQYEEQISSIKREFGYKMEQEKSKSSLALNQVELLSRRPSFRPAPQDPRPDQTLIIERLKAQLNHTQEEFSKAVANYKQQLKEMKKKYYSSRVYGIQNMSQRLQSYKASANRQLKTPEDIITMLEHQLTEEKARSSYLETSVNESRMELLKVKEEFPQTLTQSLSKQEEEFHEVLQSEIKSIELNYNMKIDALYHSTLNEKKEIRTSYQSDLSKLKEKYKILKNKCSELEKLLEVKHPRPEDTKKINELEGVIKLLEKQLRRANKDLSSTKRELLHKEDMYTRFLGPGQFSNTPDIIFRKRNISAGRPATRGITRKKGKRNANLSIT